VRFWRKRDKLDKATEAGESIDSSMQVNADQRRRSQPARTR